MSDRRIRRLCFTEMFTPKLVTVLREGYGLGDLQTDAIAGLTVTIVALPLSMAIAIACGLSPERGLYTAIVGGFIVAWRQPFPDWRPSRRLHCLNLLDRLASGLRRACPRDNDGGRNHAHCRFMRWGTYIKYIPYPVTVGFTAGIATIIFASQIKELLGLDVAKEPAELVPKLAALGAAIGTINPATVVLSLLAIFIILGIRRLRPGWPGMLIAVAVCAALTACCIVTWRRSDRGLAECRKTFLHRCCRRSIPQKCARFCLMLSRLPCSARSSHFFRPSSPTA